MPSRRISRPERPLTIRVEERGTASIVALEGSCSMEVSGRIQETLVGIATEKAGPLIVDMTLLDFIDSTGLGGIVAAHLRGRHKRAAIRLVNPRPAIREVLDVTRLNHLFPVYETLDAALAAAN